MADRKTSNDDFIKKPTYQEAVILPGGGQRAEASEALHQRTVVTSMTHGTIDLRYGVLPASVQFDLLMPGWCAIGVLWRRVIVSRPPGGGFATIQSARGR
jgi:hypothetical protein